jgi:hypothetical protein
VAPPQKAPFDVVASHVIVKTFQDGAYLREFTMTLRLVDSGKAAQSELPDEK